VLNVELVSSGFLKSFLIQFCFKILATGCTLYGFSEPQFSGEGVSIRGPIVYPQSPGFDYGVAKGFR
jgi:hypothetical protein